MWFLSAILVFFTLSSSESTSKDLTFSLKELYYEISSAALESNEYYLESGNVSANDLISQVMNVEFDENILEKYREMDVMNGIKEQNEMMELMEKWKQKKTDLKEDVGKGFDEMDNMEMRDVPGLIKKRIDVVSNRMTKIQERSGPTFEFSNYDNKMVKYLGTESERLSHGLREVLPKLESFSTSVSEKKEFELFTKYLNVYKGTFSGAMTGIEPELLFVKELSESDIILVELKTLIDSVGNEKENMEKLKAMISKLIKVEEEMKVLEELRDSEAPEKIQELLKTLGNDVGALFKKSHGKLIISEEILEKISPELENIVNLVHIIDRKLHCLNMKPTDLTSLKSTIPSGSLQEKFEKLQSCLEKIDTSVDFSPEIAQIKMFSETVKYKISEKMPKWMEMFTTFALKVKKQIETVSQQWNTFLEKPDTEPSDEMMSELKIFDENLNTLADVIKNVFEQARDKFAVELALLEMYRTFPRRALTSEWDSINKTNEKLSKQIEFITCYTELKTANPKIRNEIIEIMDIPSKAFNYDMEPFENTVEAVNLFQDAYKMVGELKTWKFGRNDFPLNFEDVKGISDGVDVVKKILEIKNTWRMLNMEPSEPFWKEISEFVEKLSLDSVLTPPTIDVSEYQGEQKAEILKILNTIQNLGDYGNRLEKMNDGLKRVKTWKETAKTTSDEEATCDCWTVIENPSCESSSLLPEATPDDPIQEFQV